MKIGQRIKRLFRRQRAAEELDARAEAERVRREDETAITDKLGPRIFKY